MIDIFTLDNALNHTLDNFAKGVNIALPAKVISFNASNQRASVQPVIQAVIYDKNSNEKIINRVGEKIGVKNVEMPVIEDVPVQYLRAGNFMITLPIKSGDTGLLVFCHRDISRWKKQGGIAKQADLNLFDYSNAVYLPFIASEKNAISDYNSTGIEIRGENDKIVLDGNNITVESSGNVTVTATQADIDANIINLAGGGAGVARIGDAVQVDPLTHIGTITAGSVKVTSGWQH